MATEKNKIPALLILTLAAAAILAAAPFFGSAEVTRADIAGILDRAVKTPGERIFWDVRMPRVILCFIAGATLSGCGMAFQALFRNPLATPYTLGVSGGAAFGAVLAIRSGANFSFFAASGRQVFAFVGALASIALVYGISRSKRGFTMATMLLTGVAVSFFFAALVMFVQYFADFSRSFAMVRWMMGGMSVIGYREVTQIAAFSLIGLAIIFSMRNELNLMLTGDEIAAGRGVDVDRVRRALFIGVSLSVGSVVSFCGPIDFIGLIVPHVMRLIFGSDHFDLTPACLIGGGAFLVVCDVFARLIISPAEMPVGIITAMLGGPFFIWLLFRHPN